MHIGQIWVLKENIKLLSRDSINIYFSANNDLIRALKIIGIRPLTTDQRSIDIGWDGEYTIMYHMIFNLGKEEERISDARNFMSSGCLFRNFTAVEERVLVA